MVHLAGRPPRPEDWEMCAQESVDRLTNHIERPISREDLSGTLVAVVAR